MPIYEYQCTVCDHSFEQRQSFDSEPICACPQCENRARRLFKPAPIIFKGSGFYVTDYNGKSPSASPNASEETEAKVETKVTAASNGNGESSKSTSE
jgi:putative FmdB family regulatory protein